MTTWIDADGDLIFGRRVARTDADSHAEHGRHPDRIDRTHRVYLLAAFEENVMPGGASREGIGDHDLAFGVRVEKVFARKRLQRPLALEAELGRLDSKLMAAGLAVLGEAAQHPLIEPQLGIAQTTRSLRPTTRRRDAGRGQRVRDSHRRTIAVSASRTHSSGGSPATPEGI